MAFNDPSIIRKLIFHPVSIKRNNNYGTFLYHGFIHGDMNHLIFNMISFYFFGPTLERIFVAENGKIGSTYYILFYLSAIVVSSIYSYFKHKDDERYMALGASGGISAVIFSYIVFLPLERLNFIIPAYIYAPLFIIFSLYLSKKGQDNIGHDAHISGALYGFLFTIILFPDSLKNFIWQIGNAF